MSNTQPAEFYPSFPQSWPGETPGVYLNASSSISASVSQSQLVPVVVSNSFPQVDSPLNVLTGGDPVWPSGYQPWPGVPTNATRSVVSSSQYR